jgi:hypothetical protein
MAVMSLKPAAASTMLRPGTPLCWVLCTFDPRTVQLVASRYTNYAIPAHGSEDGVLESRSAGGIEGVVGEAD